MASGEREQVLADFQACTQLDDIETCIAVLDQHDWNLMKAVQSVMSEGQSEPQIGGDPIAIQAPILPHPPGVEFFSSGIFSDPIPWRSGANVIDASTSFDPGSASGPGPGPSTSYSAQSRSRMLHFNVEYRDKNVDVVLADSDTVARIKDVLHGELLVPVCKQELKGWSNRKVHDDTILRDLHLPKENKLFLLTPNYVPQASDSEDSSSFENLNRTYNLKISYNDGSKYDQLTLNFHGTKTVNEVKTDIYAVIDVPVRHQFWSGWPAASSDENMTIGSCGLNYPTHELTVKRTASHHPRATTSDTAMEIEISDDESLPENFPTYDDSEMFSHEDHVGQSRKLEPLMPESVKDEMEALEHFTKVFRDRYGECHPVFYVGPLDNAIRDSLVCSAKERKQLAIYLHHDGSILSNVFCSQTLCNEGVVNFLTSNFIIWAWDMTLDTNHARLTTLATRHFGSVAATQIRGYSPDNFPVLLIISRSRMTNEVADVIRGDVTVDELMSRLIQDQEVFSEQQQKDVVEEAERDARSMIRTEQDVAYQQSLLVDRQKREAKLVEEQRVEAETLEQQAKEAEEHRQKVEAAEVKQAIEESLARAIPDEPPEGTKKLICKLRIRTPSVVLQRRFFGDNTLQVVINFITAQGYHLEEHKLLTTFPRRDLTACDFSETLEKLKLCPQETLILEERS